MGKPLKPKLQDNITPCSAPIRFQHFQIKEGFFFQSLKLCRKLKLFHLYIISIGRLPRSALVILQLLNADLDYTMPVNGL